MVKRETMTMAGLGAIVLGILLIIILMGLIPIIGEQTESAIQIGSNSEWNSTINSDIPTGVNFYTSVVPFVVLAALILVTGGFLTTLHYMRE